jgi:hypothetical protein
MRKQMHRQIKVLNLNLSISVFYTSINISLVFQIQTLLKLIPIIFYLSPQMPNHRRKLSNLKFSKDSEVWSVLQLQNSLA